MPTLWGGNEEELKMTTSTIAKRKPMSIPLLSLGFLALVVAAFGVMYVFMEPKFVELTPAQAEHRDYVKAEITKGLPPGTLVRTSWGWELVDIRGTNDSWVFTQDRSSRSRYGLENPSHIDVLISFVRPDHQDYATARKEFLPISPLKSPHTR